jgi:3-methyladenine DNA glycosylase AlkD
MSQIVMKIREDLGKSADASTKASFQRFFKEGVRCHGVKTGLVNQIAKEHWKEVQSMEKSKIFQLCEELFSSGYCEEAFVASYWTPRLEDRYEPGDLLVFKDWIERYIDNWAECDTFCNHTVGSFIEKYPERIDELKSWARSENRWLKRAAAVSLIVPAKRGRFLSDAFEIADILLTDLDDMVQKGYGWLLKEESRLHQREVFSHVIENRASMPRKALR